MNKTSKSYNMFVTIYEDVFNKFNKSKDTIFENMDYKPNVDNLYRQFISAPEYNIFLEAKNKVDQHSVIRNWIVDNLFFETYLNVKHDLIVENSSLPYHIEYRLNNSFDTIIKNRSVLLTEYDQVITEDKYDFLTKASTYALGGSLAGYGILTGGFLPTIAGIALIGLTTILGVNDKTKRDIIKQFEQAGEAFGKIVTLDLPFLDLETKKEILASINAEEIADAFKECVNIIGWNPADSNKLTRFIERLGNSSKEYNYARCVGTKLINFYATLLENLYKILKSSDVDDKVITTYETGLKRGLVTEALFRDIARLARNKKIYKLLEIVNKTSKTVQEIIDTFSNSSDPEYVRIGHDLSKQLDSELRRIAYEIAKERSKPALNRRNNDFYKEGRSAENHKPNTRDFARERDNRRQNNQHSENPF